MRLRRRGEDVLLRDWASEIFDRMAASCDVLDQGAEVHAYCDALQKQRAKIEDPDLTPSARMLADMADNREEFYHFALRMSQQHQQRFSERPLEAGRLAQFEETARRSLQKQREIEAADDISFETFMQNYFAQT